MSRQPDDKTISDLRDAEIRRLSGLPPFPSERPGDERGVLLSDRIKEYCEKYQLIHPFDERKLLEPAGYSLTVGRNYSVRGEIRSLNDGMKLEIQPYQVAVIETFETLNIPEFLIDRWNIKVKLAYQGLLWVGAAQVDPGFRGHLCCPIYNLSTNPVPLNFRQPLALIDFVTTTRYEEGRCKRFPWRDRKMIVFQEYPLLDSGIEREVGKFKETIEEAGKQTAQELAKAKETSEASFLSVQRRIDTLVTLLFAVVAVLFAGLGIVATRVNEQVRFLSTPVVAASALFSRSGLFLQLTGTVKTLS